MGTVTTIITAGSSHPNHGGINPQATLSLIENDRLAWRLDEVHEDRRTIWLPISPETALEDGLLVLAAWSIRDERVTELLDQAAPGKWDVEHVTIADVLGTPSDELRAAVRDAVGRAKLVITVLPESLLMHQLDLFGSLDCDVEVCVPAYWRRTNPWRSETVVGGQLP